MYPDFLQEYTREEYCELRKQFPEDGTEYSQWQKLPKLPDEGKTVITFDGENPSDEIQFDELCFHKDSYNNDTERTYWRHHYFWDRINFDIHYWMYAPENPPGNYGYNVGD